MTTLFITTSGKELSHNTVYSVYCNARFYLGARYVKSHPRFTNAIICDLDLDNKDVDELTDYIQGLNATLQDIEFVSIVSKGLFNNDTIITL